MADWSYAQQACTWMTCTNCQSTSMQRSELFQNITRIVDLNKGVVESINPPFHWDSGERWDFYGEEIVSKAITATGWNKLLDYIKEAYNFCTIESIKPFYQQALEQFNTLESGDSIYVKPGDKITAERINGVINRVDILNKLTYTHSPYTRSGNFFAGSEEDNELGRFDGLTTTDKNGKKYKFCPNLLTTTLICPDVQAAKKRQGSYTGVEPGAKVNKFILQRLYERITQTMLVFGGCEDVNISPCLKKMTKSETKTLCQTEVMQQCL